MIEKLKEGIYRVYIPFEDIYTSAFILTEGKKAIILDSGACSEDAKKYIVPAIEELNVDPIYLVTSHDHGDHCGGIDEMKRQFPLAKHLSFLQKNIEDDEILLCRFRTLNLKGHTDDSLAVLDLETGTLLSCDCLQMYGVSKYGGNFDNYKLYIDSLNRLRQLKIHTIIASHDFVPYGCIAEGETEVHRYLNECERVVTEIVEFVKLHKSESSTAIAELFNDEHFNVPPISTTTVVNIRKVLRK